MNAIEKIDSWTDSRRAPLWMDVVRIVLGIFIFYKGFIFTTNFESLTQNIATMNLVFLTIPTAHYISFAHLIGGMLISLGAYTRIASFLNIPVLVGAVLFNYQVFITVDNHMELSAAVIVLLLLVMVFVYGGGRFSIDELRRRDILRKQTQVHSITQA